MTMVPLAVRMPKTLYEEFGKACKKQGETRSDVVRRMIAEFVGKSEPKVKKRGRPKKKRKKS
jgi:metal-responsive CopG/Arc/MetJ family transcriptional regulator